MMETRVYVVPQGQDELERGYRSHRLVIDSAGMDDLDVYTLYAVIPSLGVNWKDAWRHPPKCFSAVMVRALCELAGRLGHELEFIENAEQNLVESASLASQEKRERFEYMDLRHGPPVINHK